MAELEWARLTAPEIARFRDKGAIVLLPVGAVEQHGPHLPANTDALTAGAVSVLAASRVHGVPVLVAPTLPFGFSPHHVSMPATLSLRLSTYLATVGDLVRGIIESGFPRVLLVNGHGGNSAPLRSLVVEMVTDGAPVGFVDYFAPGEPQYRQLLATEFQRVGHACAFEAALVMALDPPGAEKISKAVRGLKPRLQQPYLESGAKEDPISAAGAWWPPIFQADDPGWYGKPGDATPELGEKLRDIVADALARYIEKFAATPLRLGISRDASKPSYAPALTGKKRAKRK